MDDRELMLLKDRVEGLEAAVAELQERQGAIADLLDRTITVLRRAHGDDVLTELEPAAEDALAP